MNEAGMDKELLIKLLKENDIISFDIFDTLLLRPFAKPTDLFWFMEKELAKPGFALQRIRNEQELRSKIVGTEEVLLSDIYREMPQYFELMSLELEYEEKLLYPNTEMLEIFKIASEMNKVIIIISDIYLDELFIAKILKAKGFGDYDKLYVSSTWGMQKWTGNLFRFVLSDLKRLPEKILHIGDNFHSDCEVAKSLGMNFFFYQKVIDRYFDINPYRNKIQQTNRDDHVYSALLMQVADRYRYKFNGYWQRFGYEIAGPALYAFVKYIAEKAQDYSNVTDIAFIARDGYFLKKIYDVFFHHENIRTHYIYAPRSCNLLYRLDYNVKYYDSLSQMKTILNHYKFCFLEKDVNIEALSLNEAKSLMKANYGKIKKSAKKSHEEYKKYLENKIFGNGRVLVVDTITDKFSAQKLISGSISNKVSGIYWLVLDQINKKSFDCFQKEHRHKLKSWDLMEFIMTSPEPPIQIVKNETPIYYPANRFEKERIEIFYEMTRGIDEFIESVKNSPLSKMDIDNNIITCWINDFLANPKPVDRDIFKSVFFSITPDHSDLNSLDPFRDITQSENENVSLKQRCKKFVKCIFRPIYRKIMNRLLVDLNMISILEVRKENEYLVNEVRELKQNINNLIDIQNSLLKKSGSYRRRRIKSMK